MGTYETRRVVELGGLARLSEPWRALGEVRQASPVDGFAWVEAAAEVFRDDYRLEVTTVEEHGRVTAIAPLARRRDNPLRLLLLGAAELAEPTDFLYSSEAALEALVDGLFVAGVPLFLKRIPADSGTLDAFHRLARGRRIVVVRPAPGTPWIPLDDGAKEPEDRFNAGRRSDFRRLVRRAEKRGSLEYSVACPSEDDLDQALEEAFLVEDRSWKGREGSSLARDVRRAAFYRRFGATSLRAGTLRIAKLAIGGQPAAMQIAIQEHGRFSLLKIGYDESFKECSPGTLLMLHTIRHAMHEGLAAYDFLGAEAPWTQTWTERTRTCVAVRVYPPDVRSAAVFAAEVAVRSWPRIKSMLRRP